MIVEVGIIILGYMLGSIPTAYLIGKYKYGFDIRERGSGNVGGANAARTMGMKVGLLSGFVDIFKGTLAVYIAIWYVSMNSRTDLIITSDPNALIALTGFFAVIGHCYSFILRFQGGKGGATTAGVILALDPLTFLVLLVVWVIVVGSTRFTSLGNLIAVWVIPPMFVIRHDILVRWANIVETNAYVLLSMALVFLIYYKHRANIQRLLSGTERKVGQKE